MTLQLEVIGPCVVLLVAGLLALARPAGALVLVAEVVSLGLLLRLWQLTGAGALVLSLYDPLPGIAISFRVDHLGILFASVGIGAGLLLALPWMLRPLRGRGRFVGWLLLAQAGMVNVALAGGLESLAAGWAMTAAALSLMALAIRLDQPGRGVYGRATAWHLGAHMVAAALLLAGVVTVEVTAGTGAFDSVPVGAIDTRAYVLMAAAAAIVLLDLGTMVRALRDPLAGAFAVASVCVPMSCYLLLLLYDLGDGRLPDRGLNIALTLLGGAAALVFAARSLWAVDLGEALTSLLQAAAALLLVAAGSGSGIGIGAVAIGAISLGLGASLAFAVVDAGRGRLPSFVRQASALLSTATSVAALFALAWAGGIGAGLVSATRIATVQATVAVGGLAALAAAPVLLAMLLMAFAAYKAGRFGGGPAPDAGAAVRLLLLAAAMPTATVLAPAVVYPTIEPIAAAVLRITPAEVKNALETSPAGNAVILIGLGLALVAAVWLARPGGRLDLRLGLPGARGYLPPALTVLPRIWLARAGGRVRGPGLALVALMSRGRVPATIIAFGATVAAISSLLR